MESGDVGYEGGARSGGVRSLETHRWTGWPTVYERIRLAEVRIVKLGCGKCVASRFRG